MRDRRLFWSYGPRRAFHHPSGWETCRHARRYENAIPEGPNTPGTRRKIELSLLDDLCVDCARLMPTEVYRRARPAASRAALVRREAGLDTS